MRCLLGGVYKRAAFKRGNTVSNCFARLVLVPVGLTKNALAARLSLNVVLEESLYCLKLEFCLIFLFCPFCGRYKMRLS